MKFKLSNRQFLSVAIIVFYLIPIFFFSIYSIQLMTPHKSWSLLSLGLLLAVIGTLSLIFLISCWEQTIEERCLKQSMLYSVPLQTPVAEQREAKVTSLDPSLTYEHLPERLTTDPLPSQEGSKELNLIQTALEESQKQQDELLGTLQSKTEEYQKLEEEVSQHKHKAEQIAQDFADYKLFSEEQLKQKQLQLNALQQTIEDQRSEMEKRQDQIQQLDTKVHDLSYEIKTLLYLHEDEVVSSNKSPKFSRERLPAPPTEFEKETEEEVAIALLQDPIYEENKNKENIIQTSAEAAQLLKKCIQVAQKMTGANYYSHEASSRYRTFSPSHFAIDQRRLFDGLRSEKGALIFIYSQKDNKHIFANNESKTLLGWSPEKFATDFSGIMQEGAQEWRKALQLLTTAPESQVRLLAKTKQGHEMVMNCHLGVIPSGLFRNYIVGILYPA